MKQKTLIILLILTVFGMEQIHAQRSISKLGENYYVAGALTNDINRIAARQDCQNWCWAACIEMVLKYHGLQVEQEEVVRKIYGPTLPCLTGNAQQIMGALSGWAPDSRGRFSEIHARYGAYNATDLIDQLSRQWPIIVGLHQEGHAYVLTAIYYSTDQWNNPIVDKVVLRDPWPHNPSRREMSWSTFLNKNPEFFKVWVNRL